MSDTPYVGRFAPSPTGPLHAGSLVAALGSWLAARAAGGRWIVRIEDLDRSRCVAGMDRLILEQLAAHGLVWDGDVLYQSTRDDAYAEALDRLRALGRVYPCACTRAELADAPRNADGETVYPGTCRDGLAAGRAPRAWRVRVDDARIAFDDRRCGPIQQTLAGEVGDFVVRRADGLFAYQLAVVVDDAAQGITEVVRGADLLGNTPRQIFLQRCLGLPTPGYRHLPLLRHADGQKLSKQTGATALPFVRPEQALRAALATLGLLPPNAGSVRELLDWGVAQFARDDTDRLVKRTTQA